MGEFFDVDPADEAAYENFMPAAADHFADIDAPQIDSFYLPD